MAANPQEPPAGGSRSRWSDLDRPPLSAAALRTALTAPEGPLTALEVVEATGSTNADLITAARAGKAPAGTVLIAEEQIAGRGRLGRDWIAPARSGIFLSVLLEPAAPAGRWSWLPLLAGVATATALARTAGVETALKWPNDLLVTVDDAERKCGGILVERTETATGAPAAVVGIGVNVSQRAEELPIPGAASLATAGAAATDRDPLVRAVLRALADWYGRWSRAGGDAEASGLREAYVAACATLGRQVSAQLPGGEEVHGEAVGIDPAGRLVLAVDDGDRRPLDAGDIVHLRPAR